MFIIKDQGKIYLISDLFLNDLFLIKDIEEENKFKEVKALKQLYEIIKIKNSSNFSEKYFKRKKTMDDLHRQNFFVKIIQSEESSAVKYLLNESIDKLQLTFKNMDSTYKDFDEINKKNFLCEYITISGAYYGCLKTNKKELYFFTKKTFFSEKAHEYGVPVIYFSN